MRREVTSASKLQDREQMLTGGCVLRCMYHLALELHRPGVRSTGLCERPHSAFRTTEDTLGIRKWAGALPYASGQRIPLKLTEDSSCEFAAAGSTDVATWTGLVKYHQECEVKHEAPGKDAMVYYLLG